MQPIQFLHQPAEDTSFRLHYSRGARQVTCSHPAVWLDGAALFFQGRARDEQMCTLPADGLLRRIRRSFDGLLGTIGVYCGVLLDPSQEELSLFVDPHANGILYWYRDGEQIIVSSNLDWLARRCGCKLHIDWQAWSELLGMHFVNGSRTYFEEIKCVDLQQTVHFDLLTATVGFEDHRWSLKCVTPEKSPAETYRDIAELFDEGVARLAHWQPEVSLALSGGLDSRMILASLKKHGAQVHTYTTDTDVGAGDDPIYAKRISDGYGAGHQYIRLPDDWYENTVDRYYPLTSYESWYHVWFQGMGDRLPDLGGQPILTGIDGDGYLRASHIPSPRGDLDEMYAGLSHHNYADVFHAGFTAAIDQGARQGFRQEFGRYAGLPASIFYFRMAGRTRRNIHWMLRQFSTRFECLSMFQYPPYIEYVFGLADRYKFNPELQFEVMRVLDPHTLDYPSNFPAMKEQYYHERIRKYNPATIAKFRGLIAGDSVLRSLNLLDTHKVRALFSRIETLDLAVYPRFILLQPVYMLARWLETYAGLLVDETFPAGTSGRIASRQAAPQAGSGIPDLLAMFLPTLRDWVQTTPQGVRIRDAYENEQDENYAPAAGAVVLAQALNEHLEVEPTLEQYLKRSGQLLSQVGGVRPFQQVFVLHYLSLSLLLLSPEKQAASLAGVRAELAHFVDGCPVLNTNCAALKLANELFLEALHIRPADPKLVRELAAHLTAARLPSGFINDQVEKGDGGRFQHGDDMPVAYHAFILFVCTCALRYGSWPNSLKNERKQISGLVEAGLDWLAKADTPDGSFAMAGRGKYHLFARGVRCALHTYQGDRQGLSLALLDWLGHLREDGTYDVTLNRLPHGLRVGFADYARVSMYNSLGMAALAVAQHMLSRPNAPAERSARPKKNAPLEIDPAGGYAFYRWKKHFAAVTLPGRESAGGSLAMQVFHVRLDGQPTPLAEFSMQSRQPVEPDRLDNGIFEGWLACAADGEWRLPEFHAVAVRDLGDGGIRLTAEDDRFQCEKIIRFSENGICFRYTLTPKIALKKLIHALPLCVDDGLNPMRILPLSSQSVNLTFGGRLYQVVCAKARQHTCLLERSTASVSGIATRLQYTLLETEHPAHQPFTWETEVTDHGPVPAQTAPNAALKLDDPLSAILGAELTYDQPLRVGMPVEIFTQARGENLEYAWYVLDRESGSSRKVFVQMYGKSNRLVWKPAGAGRFVVMLFIRDSERMIKSMIWPDVLEVAA